MKNKKIICTLLAILTVIGLLPSIVFAGGEQSGELTYKKVDKPISEEMYQLVLDGVDCGEIVLAANGNGWSIKSGDRYLNNEGDKIVWGRQATTAWTYKKGAFTVDITTTQKTSGRHVLFLYIPGTTTTVTTTYYLTSVANGAKLSPYFVGADLFVPDYKIMLEQAIAAKETAENERDTLQGQLNDLTELYNQTLLALEHAKTALKDAQEQLMQKDEELSVAEAKLQQKIDQLNDAQVQLQQKNEQLEQAQVQLNQKNEELSALNTALEQANAALEQAEAAKAEAEAAKAEAEAELAELVEILGMANAATKGYLQAAAGLCSSAQSLDDVFAIRDTLVNVMIQINNALSSLYTDD